MVASLLGAILTILGFVNKLFSLVDFLIIHWILMPVLLFVVASLLSYVYFKALIEKKVKFETNLKKKGQVRRNYSMLRYFLISFLAIITLLSILYTWRTIGPNKRNIDIIWTPYD